jgi:hypothetical protein
MELQRRIQGGIGKPVPSHGSGIREVGINFFACQQTFFALFHPDKNPTQVLVNTSLQVKAITPQTLSTNHNRYPATIVLSCRSAALLNKGA